MKRLATGLILVLSLMFASCNEDDTQFAKGDYFPLQSLEWKYQRWIGSEPDFTDFGNITLRSTGTVVADGKRYHRITGWDDYIDFEARREGSEYFERNALFEDNKEYKFLDTEKSVGESWSYVVGDYQKVEYSVLSKESLQKINGTSYRNVITMKVDYYIPGDTGEFQLWISAQHVYAEGIGEVYSFMPYPASLVYGDVKSVRVDAKIRLQ